MTVLANEQVIDGRGWRSGALVERRKLSQWFLKITDFADDLLDGLEALEQWPDKVRLMQENWIGKSVRACSSASRSTAVDGIDERWTSSSTRPDTLFGASFAAVARRSPGRAARWRDGDRAVPPFAERVPPRGTTAAERRDRRRKRASTPASTVIHPFDPAPKLPLFVANFVLMDYGTGAIMAVPGA